MSNKLNISLLDHEFQSLRVSALTNACAITPFVHNVTIGPNAVSPQLKSDDTPKKTENVKASSKSPSTKSLNSIENNYDALINTKTGTTTLSRFLHDKEVERRVAVNNVFNDMLRKMANKRSEMMSKFWQQQELEYEKKSQEYRSREMELMREWAVEDQIRKIEEEKLNKENKAHSERMKKLLEKQLESTKLFEELNQSYSQICETHQDITNIICSDKIDGVKILSEYESRLTSVLMSTNNLIEKCKFGTISSEDVLKATKLEAEMKELRNQIHQSVINTKQQQQPQKVVNVVNKPAVVESNENKQQTVIKSNIETNGINPDKVKSKDAIETNQFCSKTSFNNYMELQDYLTDYENSLKDLLNDQSMKKFRQDCQKAVTTTVNAISSVSGEHMKDKYDKLSKLLSGERVPFGNSFVCSGMHPQGTSFCKDILAKKIVLQGELLVSSNPDAAFPIASIVVALWAQFPDFGKLLCARFQKTCPYIVPMIMPQISGRNIEEFYKSRGYIYDENGAVEKQDKFLKRMSGLFKLYATIWIIKMPYCVKAQHPHNMSNGWRWVAAFINLTPEVDITATLLHDFFTLCGSHCYKYYKIQFAKILKYLLSDYLVELNKIDTGGPKTRLDNLIQEIINKGQIESPAGLQSVYTW